MCATDRTKLATPDVDINNKFYELAVIVKRRIVTSSAGNRLRI